MEAADWKRVFKVGANAIRNKETDLLFIALMAMAAECDKVAKAIAAADPCATFLVKDKIRYQCVLKRHGTGRHRMEPTPGWVPGGGTNQWPLTGN